MNSIKAPILLNGTKIIDSTECTYVLLDQEGKRKTLTLKPHVDTEISWNSEKTKENHPILQSVTNSHKNYRYEYIQESKILHFQYNRCKNMKDNPFSKFVNEMFNVIDNNQVDVLVVDLRNNGGGNSMVLNAFFSALKKRKFLNHPDKLYVVLGRRTFSSALLNAYKFKRKTSATFIGEIPGAKLNHYGELKTLKLMNNGLEVYYSSKYFKNTNEGEDSFIPDVIVEPSISDYYLSKDSVISKVVELKRN